MGKNRVGSNMLKGVIAAAVALFMGIGAWNRFGGFHLTFFYALVLLVLLMTISFIDMKTLRIPNEMNLLLLIYALAAPAVMGEITWSSRLGGILAVSLPMFLMTVAIPGSFGGGDIKLMAVCGFLLGTKNILCAAFLAVFAGGLFAILGLVTGKLKRGDHFAFGPFLAAGVWISFLWGEDLLKWYLNLLIY